MGNVESCDGLRLCESGQAAEADAATIHVDEHDTTILGHTVYAMGGTGSADNVPHLISVEKMDLDGDPRNWKWEKVAQMNKPRLGACTTSCDGNVYIAGGWTGAEHDNTMEVLPTDVAEPTWKLTKSMKAPRTFAGMTSYRGCLFVCGGMTTQPTENDVVQWNTSTVEKFVCESTSWKGVHSMVKPRLGPSVVTWDTETASYIVVIGGVDGDGTALKTVEKLDPHQQKWDDLPDLPEPRAAPGAAVYNGEIYIFGGCGLDGVPLASGYKLVGGKRWEALPAMNVARGGFGLVSAGKYLVAVGGSSQISNHLKDTEYLDLTTCGRADAGWTYGPSMQHDRRYPGVVSVPRRSSKGDAQNDQGFAGDENGKPN